MNQHERQSALRELRRSLKKNKQEILTTLSRETKRSELECFTTEYIPSRANIDWLLDIGDTFHTPQIFSSGLSLMFGGKNISEERIPLGKILIIATWNYPLQISFRQILFALFAGNTVYFKPSPYAEKTAELLYKIFIFVEEFSKKIILLPSDPQSIDTLWDTINGVVFTGSTTVGKLVAIKAAERMIPAIIEASGYDSVVIGEQLPNKTQLEHIVWALTTHSGETCVAPKIIWVKRSNMNEFTTQIKLTIQEYLQSERWEGYSTPNTLASINAFRESASRLQFAEVLIDSDRLTIIEAPNVDALREHTQECLENNGFPFAPVLTLIAYDSLAEVAEWTSSEYAGLMTSTFAMSNSERKFIENNSTTSVINHNEMVVSAGAPAISMGGSGISGIGRSGGMEYLRQVTKTRTVVSAGIFASVSLPRWSLSNGRNKLGYRFLEWMKKII